MDRVFEPHAKHDQLIERLNQHKYAVAKGRIWLDHGLVDIDGTLEELGVNADAVIRYEALDGICFPWSNLDFAVHNTRECRFIEERVQVVHARLDTTFNELRLAWSKHKKTFNPDYVISLDGNKLFIGRERESYQNGATGESTL